MSKEIFVFGSNLAGMHGAGSALAAVEEHGAILGVGVGRQGNSYAIPTKGQYFEILPIKLIRLYVEQFIQYAEEHPELTFNVVAIGCGYAGFQPDDIAPMFANAPKNCKLPVSFEAVLSS